ncbi:MAG: PD-(D/E)XK nuclease family protein [Ignavibacteriaceae bacterium]
MILTKCKVEAVDLDQRIDDTIKNEELDKLLLIVPTNRKIRYLKKDIISFSPGKATGKINLETIGTYAANLFFCDSPGSKTNVHQMKILSDAASSVLLKQSIHGSSLKYFDNNAVPPGTLDRIRNVISEYKKHGITPPKLKQESVTLDGTEKLKAEDIAEIYEKYRQKCNELYVKEIGDVYSEMVQLPADEFSERFRELYPKVNLIVINGFDEFTIPEIEIINYTANINSMDLFIQFDYYKYNNLIFSHLDKCYNIFISKGFSPVIDSSKGELNRIQNLIRENLFKKNSSGKVEILKPSITKIAGQTREREIELIAKEIKNLVIVQGIEPNQICVAFNLIHKYSPVVRNIFSTYGLPFNLTDRFSLNTSPAVISIINFLEILENDFYYKNIFRALSSGYLKTGNIDLSNLLHASVELKIISGLKNWIDSLNRGIHQLEDFEDDENSSLNKEIYKKALEDIHKLEEQLDPFSRKMTLKEFEKKFLGLIFSLDLHKKIINNDSDGFRNGNETIEKNIKAVTVFIETVKDILNLFELEYPENEKFSLKFYLNNIRTAVSSTRYNIKEKSGYGIQVTTLNEIRGLKFDYLFIAGLCDGDLPTRYTPEIFFSGSFVKNELRHQTEERYHFYQSLCSFDKGLYLTTPLQDDKQELVESNFLKEVSKHFHVTNKDEKDYLTSVYSKEELLKFTGRNLTKNPDEIIRIKEKIKNNSIPFDRIKRSVLIDQMRINEPFGDSEFTGNIYEGLSESAKENLNNYKAKEYSISQLETYAKCPYKYFAERILKLKPLEEPSEEIEALEMGSLLHNILYEFYETISGKGIIISRASNKDFNYARQILLRIAEAKINEGNFNSPLTFYEKEKILGINGRWENSILYLFLKTEREKNENFIPEFFEEAFGSLYSGEKINKGKNTAKELKAGSVKIRGKIDRIDIDDKENTFEVVDYKLNGKRPNREELDEGLSLQLPLYMYAAKELIDAQLEKDLNPDVPKIYSLKFKEGEFGKIAVNLGLKKNSSLNEKNEVLNKLIHECLESVEKFVDAIKTGKFNLTTLKDRENKVCRYCSFKPICRIQEIN